METSSADQKERSLQLDTGEVLYPITVDDAVETGFGHIREMSGLLGELRAYDQEVTQTIKYSNTSLLNDYSAQEIEYARVWLNTLGNESVSELNISHIQAGDVINRYDDNSPVYPEDLTVITGFITADGMVVYSGNGDGTINIYPVPSHWHTPDEDLPTPYEEILTPRVRYLEPLKDEQVIPLIQKIN